MKTLDKKGKIERLKWFENWLQNKDEIMNKWLLTLEPELREKLDKTPESLLPLEKYLLEKFDSPKAKRDKKYSTIWDGVSIYIVEVFMRNLPFKTVWKVDIYNELENKELYYFYPLYEYEKIGGGGNPLFHIAYALKQRKGNTIYKIYLNKFNKSINFTPKQPEIIVRKVIRSIGHAYPYFLLIKDESFTLKEIEAALKPYYQKRGENITFEYSTDEYLTIDMGLDYCFSFNMDKRDFIAQESKELAENYKGRQDKAAMVACKSRVEFWGDSDPYANYLNEAIYIMQALSQNPKIMIYDFKNNEFFGE